VQRYGVYCFGADPDETEPLADGPWVRADEAEAECAALRAEVELLKTQERNAGKLAVAHAEARWTAESRLAAATELFSECARTGQAIWPRQARAFLAAQPAAPARDALAVCRAEVDRLRGLMCRKPAAHPGAAEVFDRLQAARVAAATPPFRATCRTCGAPLDRETGRHAPEQADRVLAWAGPAARADLDDGCA
jgi:hypothetical protein